jgi:hypothetical protein
MWFFEELAHKKNTYQWIMPVSVPRMTYSGTRMPELPENSELKFTACPTEIRADSGFSEPDPNFPKPECAALVGIPSYSNRRPQF